MPTDTKFLVPVDFSEDSERALDFALQSTCNYDSPVQVYIFHVFEDTTRNFRRLDKLNAEAMERMRSAFMASQERLTKLGVQPRVKEVERRFGNGRAPNEILKMAEGIGPDMLVMGAPTSNKFKKLIANTPCTVVLVKEKGS